MDVPIGAFTTKYFSDGELFVCLDQDVRDKNIWVVTATNPPADHMLELFFLINALQRSGAIINVLFTYFGYARQDRAQSHEALASQVISSILQQFDIKQFLIVHCHSHRLHEYLNFKDCIPYEFFDHVGDQVDIIVAPDEGAAHLAQTIAAHIDKPSGYLEKKRMSDVESKVVEVHADVAGKKVLIVDDMITTGGTIINAASVIMEKGAQSVSIAATHGIFSGDAYTNIKNSLIDNVTVTNTLPQKKVEGVHVYDIGPWLTALIRSN